MRTPPRFPAAPVLSGLLFLLAAACNSQPENIVVSPPDDMKDALANAKPVELPPAILASKTFRCKDNSVVYVNFMSDNKTANLRTKPDATPIHLVAPAAGQPMTGDGGYAVSGSATASSVDITLPGKDKQSCDS